jgi:regulator of cell morphogenesis and NO signaling
MESVMQIDPGMRVRDLGKEYAKARRLFRRLGVEIDSNGQLTISEACDRVGISFKDFERTLIAMTPQTGTTMDDWAKASLEDLIHHIQNRHHAYTRQELARLGKLLEEAVNEHKDKYPELVQIQGHFVHLRKDLIDHLNAEDQVIFPALLKAPAEGHAPVFTTLEELHRMALQEHEAAEELFQNIAIITRNFSLPVDVPPAVRSLYLGLRDLEEDLFIHIYLENHLLFPRSLQGAGTFAG